MIRAGSQSNNVAQAWGHVGLTAGIVSPGDNCPVNLQRQTVIKTRCQPNDVAYSGRQSRFAGKIVPPANHSPILLQRQAVNSSRSYGNHVAQACRRDAEGVIPPSDDGAIPFESEGIKWPCRYRYHITQSDWHVGLAG